MKKVLLCFLSALIVISCNKNEMEDAGWFNDPGSSSSTGCSHNVIVYKSQYGYPLTLPDDFSLRAFGGVLVDNYYKDGYGYLVFDSDVTQIPESAFAGITSLTHILLPENCSTIGRYAFSNCKNMQSVTIPMSVTAMASNSFSNCYGELIVNCNIPDDMGWFAESKFSKITIGDDVENVGSGAFSNCYYIESVDVGKNVSYIANNAFNGSNLLAEFTGKFAWNDNRCLIIDGVLTHFAHAGITEYSIPSNVTAINSSAFHRGNNLETITLPKSITTIGAGAFSNCVSLTGVYIEDVDQWSSVAFGSANANPLYYGNSLYLNDELVTELSLSDTITVISAYAFYNCKSLSAVSIHEQITEVGSDAFAGCSELTKVDISNLSAWCQISFENQYANPLCQANNLYLNNNEVKELEIPADVAEIKSYAFYNCSSLTKVSIPSNITTIGNSAFYNCAGEWIIDSKIVESDNSSNEWLYGAKFHKLIIGNNVTKLGYDIFSGCTYLQNVTIPSSLTSIGDNAFYNTNISRVNITDLSSWCTINFESLDANPLYNGADLYLNNSKLTDLTLPSHFTKIEDYAFYGCTSITNVTLNTLITSIGYSAFANCSNIKKVYIDNLSSWCKITFGNASANPLCYANEFYVAGEKISEIELPSDITTVKSYAFYSCDELTKVIIPKNITGINNSAFADCTLIEDVLCLSATPPYISSGAFTPSYYFAIYVPTGCVNAYRSASGWSNYSSYIAEIPYTLTECTSLAITADDVSWSETSTTIYYTAVTNGTSSLYDKPLTDFTITGTAQSEAFEQNTSTTETVERTISFTYLGQTAETTITQGRFLQIINVSSSHWSYSLSYSPDATKYDAYYSSSYNYLSSSSYSDRYAIMYIDIEGYENFELYIRSYNYGTGYDYLMVSELDEDITASTSYSSSYVKANTYSYSSSGTSLSSYQLVKFNNIDGGKHRITIVFRKDYYSSSSSYRGYVLIPKNQ